MEKKKWPWKRKPSETSPGESESSGSFSWESERDSEEQNAFRESPNHSAKSPEIMLKDSMTEDEVKESMKALTEKLSSALVNVSAKEELVKQHAKVAEEAVAGWEKAENELAAMKQQLEVAVQNNLNLEVRVSHLDEALKECVRQLRQEKDQHEQNIHDAIAEKSREWGSTKLQLEKQILELQTEAEVLKTDNSLSIDPKSLLILEKLEKENSFLKQELKCLCKELESAILERELSTQAAETASKMQLESIKKVTKLEAECRRLRSVARKSSPINGLKSSPTFYSESLTDSQSDNGERMNALEIDVCRKSGSEPCCSDLWASALIAELDQFKNEKLLPKSLAPCSDEIDMMGDFLEMERLAALPDTKSNTPFTVSETASGDSVFVDNPLRDELDSMIQRVSELEKMLGKMEAEKNELEAALDETQGSLKEAQSRLFEGEIKIDELRKELRDAIDTKELLESQLVAVEVESRTFSANVDSLKDQIEKERALSVELSVKCQELESELTRTVEQTVIHQNTSSSNGELKIKQEDLAVAADKLVECQKTIESLGRQLKSLATLEDFLIDSSTISATLSSVDVLNEMGTSKTTRDKRSDIENGNIKESSPTVSMPMLSTNHAAKTLNSFGNFFT